ncbi:MAG: hypothetical protein HY711_03830 [Candidatus Melainabacteria bacterium]|nr:hypothetical protein [Candidatus Melainabacteria bacterium]
MTTDKVQPKPETHEHPAQAGHPNPEVEAKEAATSCSNHALDEYKRQTLEHKKPTNERLAESSTTPPSQDKGENATPSKKPSEDSWWDYLVLNNPFHQSAKPESTPEAKKDNRKDDSMWDKLQSLLFDDVPAGDSTRTNDSTPHSSSEFQTLPDGTKVYKDGSVVISDSTAKALKDAAPDQTIVQTYQDQDGKDVRLEFKDGKVTRVAPDGTTTEVSKDKIRIQDTEGTTTEVDKQTKKVQVVNAERGVTFEQDTENGTRTFRVKDGPTITRQKDKVVVANPDGTQQEYTEEEFRTKFRGKDGSQREIAIDLKVGSMEDNESTTDVDDIRVRNNRVKIKDDDGTIIRRRQDGTVRIKTPDGVSLLVDKDGKVSQVITEGIDEHGKPKVKKVPITKDNLPEGCTIDNEGRIHLKSGLIIGKNRQIITSRGDVLDAAKGEVTGRDSQGRKFSASCTEGGGKCRTADGTETTVDTKTGKVHSTDHKGHDVDWDSHSKEFKTKDITMTSSETTLWNGTKIGTDGSLHHKDMFVDSKGNVQFADGCTMHADGTVYTPDGGRYHCDYQSGGPKTPDSVAALATSLAASLAGKTDISPSDIAAMNGVLSLLGGMAAMLTDRGCLTGYATVKAAQGTLLEALARASGKPANIPVSPAAAQQPTATELPKGTA